MTISKKWQILEKEIKQLSYAKWSKSAIAEAINGVDHDCVIHLKEDHYIIIEISKSNSLDKLRGDINRLSSTRQYLFSQQIYSECYFVCENLSELSSLRQTGAGHKIKVFSLKEIYRELYEYEKYNQVRKEKDFGSDSTDKVIDYIDVNYLSEDGKNITISQMITRLKNGTNIILTGDFGTGKSRCVRELFSRFSAPGTNGEIFYPIAINLRDSWGTACYEDLISKHFISLGLRELVDITFRLPDTSSLFFLLDGFDEIGTQTWGSDTEDIKYAKKASLCGVKDLIKRRKIGIFIVGRAHYFNDDDEMFDCLGLNRTNTIICSCKKEFTAKEIHSYLDACNIRINYPEWLPKKPLLCEYLNTFDRKELESIIRSSRGEIKFWGLFLTMLSERDADINPMFSPDIIRKVLIELARLSRSKTDQMEALSVADIKESFLRAVGKNATGESEIMLQRLPGLGRIDSQTDERKFIDRYIINGLVADDLSRIITERDTRAYDERWINEASQKSIVYASALLEGQEANIKNQLMLSVKKANSILCGDLLHILFSMQHESIDMSGLVVENTVFSDLDLTGKEIKNLTISNSCFSFIDISKTKSDKFSIVKSDINELGGVSSKEGIPGWIDATCNVKDIRGLKTKTDIRNALSLSIHQKHFLEIIQKVFFQPGKAKSDAAIFKPVNSENKKAREKVLQYLIKNDIISFVPKVGHDGDLYRPNRKFSPRLTRIKNELHHSDDTIWKEISEMES